LIATPIVEEEQLIIVKALPDRLKNFLDGGGDVGLLVQRGDNDRERRFQVRISGTGWKDRRPRGDDAVGRESDPR
jgi:hypothetical protein